PCTSGLFEQNAARTLYAGPSKGARQRCCHCYSMKMSFFQLPSQVTIPDFEACLKEGRAGEKKNEQDRTRCLVSGATCAFARLLIERRTTQQGEAAHHHTRASSPSS